ncbi:glycoside hydrolase family 3 N-terminal domain-containing protein [Pukyongiella litopenaei]|uniref:beta-N-acetylhexosaminidase n=1 Tax=Pukyongiella litopenaei TaxID=2605946 RepID=A0A2S0MTJ6_9RHOB|nr:glycoside hydrolase family 3 N-terminal domain-containing protein [Pukyongiella litopenaei]AVO39127.1 glycoside hydrolase family 3 protein [Pukyongiella litopenaei]
MNFGATILDADGLRLSADEKAFFRDADPFGFILFGRNIETADQVRALCDDMRMAVGRDAPITIDQEGGRVQRLRPPLARQWLPPLDHVARAGDRADRAMYLRYRLIADELRSLGIDSDCAPMVDLAGPQTHEFLLNRCYGGDPGQVARLGRAVADALLAGGVLPVVKHMPGHGRSTLDSHVDLPRVSAGNAELDDTDFAPFRALRDLPMGMTAHLLYEALDADSPATLSAGVMAVIRDRIGFDGLVMTDDLGMQALQGARPDLARRALAAGCDAVLFCNAPLADRVAVADAAGRMGPRAQARAEAALAARRDPEPLDIGAAEVELSRLMGGEVYG